MARGEILEQYLASHQEGLKIHYKELNDHYDIINIS